MHQVVHSTLQYMYVCVCVHLVFSDDELKHFPGVDLWVIFDSYKTKVKQMLSTTANTNVKVIWYLDPPVKGTEERPPFPAS